MLCYDGYDGVIVVGFNSTYNNGSCFSDDLVWKKIDGKIELMEQLRHQKYRPRFLFLIRTVVHSPVVGSCNSHFSINAALFAR